MSQRARARGVLFDLDNTLTSRSECVARLASRFHVELQASLGADVTEADVRQMFHSTDRGGYNPRRAAEICARLAWRDAPPSAEWLEAYWQRELPRVSIVRPGLFDVLDGLRAQGTRLGIVTNGGVPAQNAKIDCLGLREYFPIVIVSDAVGCQKPDGRIFELALEELGTRAEDTWFVGDHPVNDVLGAAACGMRAVWVRDGHEWPPAHPEPARQITAFAELPAVLVAEHD